MPEIPLNLLKEKIIKTDIVISLLADKNGKISQLREKLRLVYHKYVNKLKECEVLQMQIDLCKLEHDPLTTNLNNLTKRYDELQKEYQLLTNSSEIRYQNKCKELEVEVKKYDELLQQKSKCTNCKESNTKYLSMSKKYEKINKQFCEVTEKYKNDQQDLKNLRSRINDIESDYQNQLKSAKIKHANEIAKLEEVINVMETSELKLKDDVFNLNNKITVLNEQLDICVANQLKENYGGINGDSIAKEDSNTSYSDDEDDSEYILEKIFKDRVPKMLSPLLDVSFHSAMEESTDNDETKNVSSTSDRDGFENTTDKVIISDKSSCSNVEKPVCDVLNYSNDKLIGDISIDEIEDIDFDISNFPQVNVRCELNVINLFENEDTQINDEEVDDILCNDVEKDVCTELNIASKFENSKITDENIDNTLAIDMKQGRSDTENIIFNQSSARNTVDKPSISDEMEEIICNVSDFDKAFCDELNINHKNESEEINIANFVNDMSGDNVKISSDVENKYLNEFSGESTSGKPLNIGNETEKIPKTNKLDINASENENENKCNNKDVTINDPEKNTKKLNIELKYMENYNTSSISLNNEAMENEHLCTLHSQVNDYLCKIIDSHNESKKFTISSHTPFNDFLGFEISNHISTHTENLANESSLLKHDQNDVSNENILDMKDFCQDRLLPEKVLSESFASSNDKTELSNYLFQENDPQDGIQEISNFEMLTPPKWSSTNILPCAKDTLISVCLEENNDNLTVNNKSYEDTYTDAQHTNVETNVMQKEYVDLNEITDDLNDSSESIVDQILNSQEQSDTYAPRTSSDDDILGFTRKSKDTKHKSKIKKQLIFNKIKAELFHSLVRYFDNRMKLNYTQNFSRRKQTKYNSYKLKNMKRLQRLRWKRLKEFCLSSTDTDSDYSRRLIRVRKRCKSKSNLQENVTKKVEDPSLNISEDESIIRDIFNEEHKYQTLISDHKELEEFYQMSSDNEKDVMNPVQIADSEPVKSVFELNTTQVLRTNKTKINDDKDDINSGDSGYVKSDLECINVGKSEKRANDKDDLLVSAKKRKFTFPEDTDDDICDTKQINLEVKSNRMSSTIVKSDLTSEICSLLQSIESSQDDSFTYENSSLKLTENDEDCEILSSSDNERNLKKDSNKIVNINNTDKLSLTRFNKKESDKETFKIKDNIEQSEASTSFQSYRQMPELKTDNIEKKNPCDIVINKIKRPPTSRISRIRNNMEKKKANIKSRIRQTISDSMPEENEEKLNVEPTVDPLYTRLREENILKPSNKVIRSSYKRSNTLKHRKEKEIPQQLNETTSAGTSESKTLEKAVTEKSRPLNQAKARALLQQILTFPNKTAIIDEVCKAFATQKHDHIARIIIHELSFDTLTKADIKYTPPAPVMTETQRILLGLLVKLDRTTSPGLLDTFASAAEKYLLTSDKLNCIENVTRLYLAICKLQKKIHKMRRMVCDALYFMGDFSIPFLFTVLSTWIEVLPVESQMSDEPLVKVIIEIVKTKNCTSPGYNLIPLKNLLKLYYDYNMDESNLNELFLQIFKKYTEIQSKDLEYALLVLCKNLTKKWVLERIDSDMKPIIDSTTNELLKSNITRLITTITKGFNCNSKDEKQVSPDNIPG